MKIEPYEQAVAYWNSRINYEKIGMPQDQSTLKLDRMRALLQNLSNPHHHYKIVHVTGTKGKGSTATMIASVLEAAGYRVGLYTSPHLVHVEERIQINRVPIDRQAITACMQEVAAACETVALEHDAPTFFEIITAVGMLHFARSQLDIAVLEVGMGGRFDATNIVDPVVSVITSISLDHMEQLGPTLEHIAFEKAGIIKHKRPVVSGVRQSGPAKVIQEVAEQQQAPLYRLGKEFDRNWLPGDITQSHAPEVQWRNIHEVSPWYSLQLWGRHQADNAAIAIQTLKILERKSLSISAEAYRSGLADAVIPGRLEIFQQAPWLVVDAAHNTSSVGILIDWIKVLPARRRCFLFAVSRDKQLREMLELLVPVADRIVFSKYSSSSRGADPQLLLQIWQELQGGPADIFDVATDGWDMLVSQVSQEDVVCATGSVYLVGEIREYLLQSKPNPPPS
ncbi:MAG TPA: folylpolyglutamate synthase/dihydrofolate synthase family protein [Gemmatales bacterium]|nr:folylpolyglutamate synthase/dihydrofolate synthase family protein [Gemmatales bacterium]